MQTGKIHICDDDQGAQNLLEKMLNAQGHKVNVFSQGQQLLQVLAEQEEEFPDLLDPPAEDPDHLEFNPGQGFWT